jgi:para-aminobenzoate synthetase component 1
VVKFDLINFRDFSGKAKNYASQFNPCVILDSCDIAPQLQKGKYKLLLALGGSQVIEPNSPKIKELFKFWSSNQCWMFGVLGYNLKNEIEDLQSKNSLCFNWPELCFFIPNNVITIDWDDNLWIYGNNSEAIYKAIKESSYETKNGAEVNIYKPIEYDFNKESYLETVNKIKREIIAGNVYELNLCSRFTYPKITIKEPFVLFEELSRISPAPFSAFLSINNKYVISASPERYLYLYGNQLVSQPIKGTRPRGFNQKQDDLLIKDLRTNLKDRAENVMIVDLVRNDLAKVSKAGTVNAEELFGIYTYSHVHQMVSTISAEIEKNTNWQQAIESTFPMGSMTGAPKIAAMTFIESLELMNREWYSGALGYLDPQGNMDFNVLIRSIFYDSLIEKMAYYAGGAITIDSNPEDEYNEMLIKTKAIHSIFNKYT